MEVLLLVLRLLLVAALYLFLGAILLLLWRDLRRTQSVEPAAPRRYGQLVVVGAAQDGAESDMPVGSVFPLQPITSLGRSTLNTVTVPDAYASSEHALLIYRDGRWWLEDRGSRNGTTLNAVLIDAPTVVSGGDIVGIGRVQLKLELEEA